MKNQSKRRYFISILFLFALFSSILIFSSTLYFMNKVTQVMNDAFSEKLQRSVSQVSSLYDNLHAQLIPGLKEASYNSEVINKLMYSHDLDSAQLLEGLKKLDELLLSYPLIHSIYLYNGQMDFFLSTTSGIEQAEGFHDREVLDTLNNYSRRFIDSYWPRTAQMKKDPYSEIVVERETLTLVLGSTPIRNTKLKGALIVNLDMEEFQALIASGMPESEDSLFIYNREGKFISQSGKMDEVLLENVYSVIAEKEEDQGVFKWDSDNLITFKYNYRLGWYFIGLMPLENINGEIISTQKTVLLVMLLLLLTALLFSYVSARRIYKPIDKLVHYVSSDRRDDSFLIEKDNELALIQNTFSRVLSEKIYLEDSFNHLSDDYRLEVFKTLLSGNEYHFWKDELNREDQALLTGPLTLYLYQIDHFPVDQSGNSRVLGEFRQSRRIVIEEMDRELRKPGEYLIDMTGRNIVCLISGEEKTSCERMKELHIRLMKQSALSLTLSWTERLNEDDRSLNRLYEEVLRQAGRKFVIGCGQIHGSYRDQEPSRRYPSDLTDRFFQKLRQGLRKETVEILDDLCAYLGEGSYGEYLDYINNFTFRFLLFFQGRDMKDLLPPLYGVRTNPKFLETLEEFRTFYVGIMDRYLDLARDESDKGRQHFIQIETLLDDNYRDDSFCVQSLSQMTRLSANYLRKIYKQFSGISLSDKINTLRLEEASRLLRETDLSVKEIYSRAGFSNYNSFFTSFKKFSSQTPALYRQKYRND